MSHEAEFNYESIERESDDAYLFIVPGMAHSVWFPKSQIIEHDEDECKVVVPEWIAIDKGLV